MRTVLASTGSTVLVLVAALVVLGIAMVVLAVWLIRSTRTDHPSLGPLETMGDRSFRRGREERREQKLASARSAGAPPPAPIVAFEDADEPSADLGVEVLESENVRAQLPD